MAVTLELWQGQIAGLQAKAMVAGTEHQLSVRRHIAALRQRRLAYKALMTGSMNASAAVFRDMLLGAERIADQFRRLFLETESRLSD
jgi:hypothetical protein